MLVSAVLVTCAPPLGAQTSAGPAGHPGELVLSVQDERLSLHATAASLAAIFTELGRQLHLDVRGDIPAHVQVTLAVDQVPLPVLLQQLGRYVNYASIRWRAGKITALRVYARPDPLPPVGETAPLAPAGGPAGGRPSRAAGKALELEIDPSHYLQHHTR